MNPIYKCKMLTISTAHISQETFKLLESEANLAPDAQPVIGFPVYKKDSNGFFLCINESRNGRFNRYDNCTEDLLDVIKYALDMECGIICFDNNCVPVRYLKSYLHEDAASQTSDPTTILRHSPGIVFPVRGHFQIKLTDDEISALFYHKQRDYRTQDAKNQIEDYLSHINVTEDVLPGKSIDSPEMEQTIQQIVDFYEYYNDLDIPANKTWRSAVEVFIKPFAEPSKSKV